MSSGEKNNILSGLNQENHGNGIDYDHFKKIMEDLELKEKLKKEAEEAAAKKAEEAKIKAIEKAKKDKEEH